jgi:hypothetical protein
MIITSQNKFKEMISCYWMLMRCRQLHELQKHECPLKLTNEAHSQLGPDVESILNAPVYNLTPIVTRGEIFVLVLIFI